MAKIANNSELKKINDEKKKMDELQKALQDKIDAFQRKSELISHRDKFLSTKKQLTNHISKMGTDYDDLLSDAGYKVAFGGEGQYRYDDGIVIKNNLLVRAFAQFLIGKIDVKVAELEKEIIS